MHLSALSRWAIWPLICAGLLSLSVIRGDWRELYRGDWAALWDWDRAALYRRVYVEPAYVLTGPRAQPLAVDTRLASLDSLGGPRILPPPICGRYAVPGIWSAQPRNTFTGNICDDALWSDPDGTPDNGDEIIIGCTTIGGSLGFKRINPGWQALLGSNGYTGPTTVDARGVLTVASPASEDWQLRGGGLLCVDADLVSDAGSDHALSGDATLTYDDGTAVAYVDGQLTVGAGASVTVETAPPYHPITLLEAAGGIVGSFSAGSLPPGWVLLQDSHFVRLDYAP